MKNLENCNSKFNLFNTAILLFSKRYRHNFVTVKSKNVYDAHWPFWMVYDRTVMSSFDWNDDELVSETVRKWNNHYKVDQILTLCGRATGL